MEAFVNGLKSVCKSGQGLGPYLLLELILPGGTLCAVLLYLWQRRHPQAANRARRAFASVARAVATAFVPRPWVPVAARMTARPSMTTALERRQRGARP